MTLVAEHPVSFITSGYVLTAESRGEGANQHLVGELRTSGSFGTLYRFHAAFTQEAILKAFAQNLPLLLSGHITEDRIYCLDSGTRIDTCQVKSGPWACGGVLPCKIH